MANDQYKATVTVSIEKRRAVKATYHIGTYDTLQDLSCPDNFSGRRSAVTLLLMAAYSVEPHKGVQEAIKKALDMVGSGTPRDVSDDQAEAFIREGVVSGDESDIPF